MKTKAGKPRKKILTFLCCLSFLLAASMLSTGCGADDGLPPDLGLDEQSSQLISFNPGGDFGGGLGFDTGRINQCIKECDRQLDVCRDHNGEDPDGVLAPCYWLHRACLDKCQNPTTP